MQLHGQRLLPPAIPVLQVRQRRRARPPRRPAAHRACCAGPCAVPAAALTGGLCRPLLLQGIPPQLLQGALGQAGGLVLGPNGLLPSYLLPGGASAALNPAALSILKGPAQLQAGALTPQQLLQLQVAGLPGQQAIVSQPLSAAMAAAGLQQQQLSALLGERRGPALPAPLAPPCRGRPAACLPAWPRHPRLRGCALAPACSRAALAPAHPLQAWTRPRSQS
jgi:hypothetical protein